jgi:hypothetical protein
MAKHRRTLKDYIALFRSPKHLFPPTAAGDGVNVTLFPNGEQEIWLADDSGHGYRVTAHSGPAGLSLQISTFIGSPPMTLAGNREGDYECFSGIDARHLEICQYKADEKSQAFKRWYQADASSRPSHPIK